MGRQPVLRNESTDTVWAKFQNAVNTLNSPAATPQQKQSAKEVVLTLAHQGGPRYEQYLNQQGWSAEFSTDGKNVKRTLRYIRGGRDDVQDDFVGRGQGQTLNPRNIVRDNKQASANQWSTASKIMDADVGATESDWLGSRLSGGKGNSGSITGVGNDTGPGFDGSFTSGGASNPMDLESPNPKYDNTFFGGIQQGALDELAANPDMAWQAFMRRGGPGRGDLRNSTASMYGENNFQSAMDMAGILGDPLMTGADTLGFADRSMRRDMSSGGNYVDPAKLLTQAFQSIGGQTDVSEQQRQIQTTLDALEPYMDPTQYRALRSRTDRVLNDYLVHGLENGTDDLSGVLLQAIQRAIGM